MLLTHSDLVIMTKIDHSSSHILINCNVMGKGMSDKAVGESWGSNGG